MILALTLLFCNIGTLCLSLRVYWETGEAFGHVQGKSEAEICDHLTRGTADETVLTTRSIFSLASAAFEEGDGRNGIAVLRCLVGLNISLNVRNAEAETLLFPAIRSENVDAVAFLIKSGVAVTLRSDKQESPAEKAIVQGCGRCLEKLLDVGVNPNETSPAKCRQKYKVTCKTGWTLVHYATAFGGDGTFLKILKDHHADFNARDAHRLSPVHWAVLRQKIQALSKLGHFGASFDVSDKQGYTPAHLVCNFLKNKPESVRYLEIIKRSGGRLNATDQHKQTPAHICARKGASHLLKFLYENTKESFEVVDSNGKTPEALATGAAGLFLANAKAAQEKKRAEEEKTRAEEEKKRAEEEKDKAENATAEIKRIARQERVLVEKCKNLSMDVDQLFDCANNTAIKVPQGFMLAGEKFCPHGNLSCAVLCPNAWACPNHSVAFINDAIETKENQCKEGYDEKSEGCSRCAASYGRQREDPFQCKKCRKPWLQWLAYVAKPTGIYAVSLWTAQKVEKGRLGSLLKIWLAFGVVVASILPSITSSHRVEAVHAHFAEFAKDSVETGGETASMATLISGPSYDCLLGGESASMTAWLGLSCAPMLVLWVLTVLWVLVQSMQLQETEMQMQRLMEGALKTSIVIINCFLPDVVAALMRFFPCMHFQYPERSHRYLQFDVTTKCHDVIPQRIGAILSAFSLGALLGPVYWLMVVQKSKQWPNRKLTLGFLISGYKEKVCWWEATVLVRKCAVAVVIATFSATYSPMLYLSNLLMVVGTALACHAFVQPYNDKFLNKLEFGTLMASFVAVFCTCLLKLESLDWAADRAVTIPALVVLFVAVTVPSVGLMVLYVKELVISSPMVAWTMMVCAARHRFTNEDDGL
ncbi:Ankyrin repeat and protein kinase domain-containing protein 1 (Protein kinase PKK2) (Sugen kinase 288) (SgK288) (X-kinase) [Durusdinium trenchii]|uniref:Ankyrin repeat and protein kinase domain-containing protein 1 (Protein kinase PKK2) (Sugen kinase 288) (SgK288) (X-kinase) n=1 Tax=Durusdinium trenchii TaxID=1381693 RepID=A0ABP0P937_9DINO